MADVLGMIVPQNEQEEIKEFVSTLLLLPKEDRAILLSMQMHLRSEETLSERESEVRTWNV